jgi:hypothetical protein
MASLKTCRFCGSKNPPDEFYCKQCKEELPASGMKVADHDVNLLVEQGARDESPERADDSLVSPIDRFLTQDADRGSGSAEECEVAFLECPWGRVRILGALQIGVDEAYSDQASMFSRYIYVSRIHARIFCLDNEWRIRDMGSRNGTFVNGVRLDPNVDVSIRNGDELRFSRSLCTTFSVGG